MNRIAWMVISVGLLIGARASAGELTRYPTFGVSFAGPAGWSKLPSDKGKTIGRWISPGSTPRNPRELILVECGLARAPSVEDLAKSVAKEYKGVVDKTPTTLGGTPALRVHAGNPSPSMQPVEWLVTIHEGLTYLVIGGVMPDHSVSSELEALRASWSWIPLEPPYKHLELRDKPLTVFGGAVSINYPALMYSHPTDQPDRALDLSLHNVVRNKSDFLAYVQMLQMAEGQSFEGVKEEFARELPRKHRMKGPFAWRTLGPDDRHFITPPIDFEPPREPSSPPSTVPIKFALVNLGDRRVVMINFTLSAPTPEERAAFDALVDKIVESIGPVTNRPR